MVAKERIEFKPEIFLRDLVILNTFLNEIYEQGQGYSAHNTCLHETPQNTQGIADVIKSFHGGDSQNQHRGLH